MGRRTCAAREGPWAQWARAVHDLIPHSKKVTVQLLSCGLHFREFKKHFFPR